MAYATHTLDELLEEATDLVGGSTVFWIDAEKQDALNEAISVWQLATGQWVAQEPITADSGYVRLPSTLISVQRVRLMTAPGGTSRTGGLTLSMISIPELDYGFPGWDSTTGTPTMWAPVGLNEIALYPPPSAPVLIAVEGLTDSPRLMSGGDIIDIGTEELTPLLGYTQHVLSFKEAGSEFNATQSGLLGLIEAAGERNGRFKKSAPYRRYMGLHKEEAERPVRGTPALGVRAND